MWNNGNGNGQGGYGQGNGYGQPQYGQGQGYGGGGGLDEETYNRMNNARDVGGARFPFIDGGRHKLAVATIEKFKHKKDGACARVLFKVLESQSHKPGSFVVKIWKLVMPPKFDSQPSDAEKFADFCMKLKNAPKGHPIGNDIRVLLELRPQEQLARGSVIECTGVANAKGTWVECYWAALPQMPEDIVRMRAQLEAEGIPSTGAQGGQFQGAPHPAQMPGQYPAQQAPMQGGPQGQYGYPAQPPQQGYGPAPTPQPQYAPPQYGAPANAPQPSQGGFVGQLPPQVPPGGYGPQGGNGGQGGTW